MRLHASAHVHARVLLLLMVVVAVCATVGGRVGVAGGEQLGRVSEMVVPRL